MSRREWVPYPWFCITACLCSASSSTPMSSRPPSCTRSWTPPVFSSAPSIWWERRRPPLPRQHCLRIAIVYSNDFLFLCFLGGFFPQGELSSDHDVVEYIMNQPNVVPRINSRILSTTRSYLDLSSTSQFTRICIPKTNLRSRFAAPGNTASFPVRH